MGSGDHESLNSPQLRPVLVATVLLGGVLPITGSVALQLSVSEWRWLDMPVHTMVEALGMFAALTLGGLILLLRKDKRVPRYYLWVACALTSAGVLAGFHAAVSLGNTSVWLHSAALLVGGSLFAMVWLPDRAPRSRLARDELEMRVQERTAELAQANEALQAENAQRKRAEEEARDLARFLPENPYPVLRVGHDGIVLHANSACEQLLPKSNGAVGEPAPDRWREFTAEVLSSGSEAQFEVEHTGRTFAFLVVPVTGTGYANWYGSDITERKRAEEALRRTVTDLARSNKELAQFAYVASHDLQEPLRKILAFGDRLKDACTGAGALSTSGRDCLERMLGASRRMEALIDGLLAYSRLGARTSPRAAVDLSEVVQAVLSDLEVQVRKVGGRVETGDLPTVEADPTQMRQLLQNLIGNALKFHRPDEPPVVKVHGEVLGAEGTPAASGAPMERHCRIIVEDNGIGFDEKYAERIFEVFQRLHGRAAYEGTGVGLAICRRIVERHHGSIVARGSPGQGATFVVTLPLGQREEASARCADTGTPSAFSLPTTIPTTAS